MRTTGSSHAPPLVIVVLVAARWSIDIEAASAIAHAVSKSYLADPILVFHHGEIRERGNHEELLRADGIYRRLYELQYEEERGEAATA